MRPFDHRQPPASHVGGAGQHQYGGHQPPRPEAPFSHVAGPPAGHSLPMYAPPHAYPVHPHAAPHAAHGMPNGGHPMPPHPSGYPSGHLPAPPHAPKQQQGGGRVEGFGASAVGELEAQRAALQQQLRQVQLQMEIEQLRALTAQQSHALQRLQHSSAAPPRGPPEPALPPSNPRSANTYAHFMHSYDGHSPAPCIFQPSAKATPPVMNGSLGIAVPLAQAPPQGARPYPLNAHPPAFAAGAPATAHQRPPVDVSRWGYAVCDPGHPFLQRVPIPPSVCLPTRGSQCYNNDVQASSTKPCGSTVCVAFGNAEGPPCPFGEACPHFHIDRGYLQAARAVLGPLCCAYHNDYFSREIVAAGTNPLLVGHRYALLLEDKTGIELSPAYLAFTVGLDALPTKGRGAAACKYISVRKHLCRLHLEGRCKWTKDCSHVHVCREVFRHVLGTPRQELLTVLSSAELPAAAMAERLTSTPAYAAYIRSPAALPLVSWVMEGGGGRRAAVLDAIIAAGALFSEDQAAAARALGRTVPSGQIAAVPAMLRRFFKPDVAIGDCAATNTTASLRTATDSAVRPEEAPVSTAESSFGPPTCAGTPAGSHSLPPSMFAPAQLLPFPPQPPMPLGAAQCAEPATCGSVSRAATSQFDASALSIAGATTSADSATHCASLHPVGLQRAGGGGGTLLTFGGDDADADEMPNAHDLLGSLLFLTAE